MQMGNTTTLFQFHKKGCQVAGGHFEHGTEVKYVASNSAQVGNTTRKFRRMWCGIFNFKNVQVTVWQQWPFQNAFLSEKAYNLKYSTGLFPNWTTHRHLQASSTDLQSQSRGKIYIDVRFRGLTKAKTAQLLVNKKCTKDKRKTVTWAIGVPESVFCSMPVLMSTSNRGALLPSMKNEGFELCPQQQILQK